MVSIKIAEVFSTFTKDELCDFEKFVKSTHFSKGRNYLPLLSIIKKFHPGFDSPDFNKQYIYKKLYPTKKYNDQVTRNLLSGLMKICEKYLVYRSITCNKLDYYVFLAEEYKNRMLYKQSEKNINSCLKLLKESGIDKDYFKKYYEMLQLKREISQSTNDTKGTIENLSQEAVSFLYFTLLEISRHLEEMAVFNHNLNANFENHLTFKVMEYFDLEKIKNFLLENKYDNSEIAELFIIHIKLLIDYKNEELFEKFRKLLAKNMSKLSRWGKYNMYLFLENTCIRLQAVNETKYRKVLFEIYREQLDLNIYNSVENGSMAADMFRNIVINALRLEQFSWVENFIENYIDSLHPDYRENMYNFCFALLNFEKSNFEQSLNDISKVKFDTFVFKFDVKILTLMIYYELGYLEAALSMIDSFKHFIIESPSISDYIREIHLNFIKYLYEIIKIHSKNKVYENNPLLKEIQNSRVRNKKWLLKSAVKS